MSLFKRGVPPESLGAEIFLAALRVPEPSPHSSKSDSDRSYNERLFLRIAAADIALHWAILKAREEQALAQKLRVARESYNTEMLRFAKTSANYAAMAQTLESRLSAYRAAAESNHHQGYAFAVGEQFAGFLAGIPSRGGDYPISDVIQGSTEFVTFLEAISDVIKTTKIS